MAFIIENGVLKRYREEEGVTEVSIPDGVTCIDDRAFFKCSSISCVVIPDGVTSIGNEAFCQCENLVNVTIPESVTSIGRAAFFRCLTLENVRIPDSVKNIDELAFCYCESFTDITLPDSLTTITNEVFYGCKKLKNIVIPDSVRIVGKNVFNGTKWLKAFKQDFVIIHGILIKYTGKEEKVTIPEGVTCIAGGAFKGNKTLKEVVIPDGVTSIMDGAFDGCKLLSVIHFPKSLQTVAGNAFEKTEWIKKDFKGNYLTVAGVLLKADKGVTNVKISDDVTVIVKGAFTGCRSIQSISVGKGLKSAENLPLEKYPKKVTVSKDNEYLTVVDGVLFSKDMKTLYYYPSTKTDSEYTIPDGVTEIRRNAFVNCLNLHSLTIPESVTTIRCMAFDKCDGFEKVHISNLEKWLSLRKSCGYLSGTNPMKYARYLILNNEIIQDTYKDEIIRSYLWGRESWIARMRRKQNG